jgi:protein-S-isoprenylcysteine O-methyltransferase Ste14
MRVINQKNKIKNKLASVSTTISAFLIPIFQYVPCTGIWFGIMSVPLISYFAFFLQNPGIIYYDINFLIRSHGFIIILLGLIFYVYALIFQLSHRKQLIRKGPYRYVRHPQYLSFIAITFGLTLIVFETSPVFNFDLGNLNPYTAILYIWILEVIAYIVLGKIEDVALKSKYKDQFIEYANEVSFMVPFLKSKLRKS